MSDEFKVQWSVSLPPSAQYAKGHMLNVRGESVEEVEALFDAALAGEFIAKATSLAELLVAAQTAQEGLSTPAPAASAASTPAPPAEDASVASLRVCTHGKREYRSGTSQKTGKSWAGYFCPEKSKANQCEVQWAD